MRTGRCATEHLGPRRRWRLGVRRRRSTASEHLRPGGGRRLGRHRRSSAGATEDLRPVRRCRRGRRSSRLPRAEDLRPRRLGAPRPEHLCPVRARRRRRARGRGRASPEDLGGGRRGRALAVGLGPDRPRSAGSASEGERPGGHRLLTLRSRTPATPLGSEHQPAARALHRRATGGDQAVIQGVAGVAVGAGDLHEGRGKR